MEPILSVNQLEYEVEKERILKNISFQVDRGDFFAILGSNGAGKSTLIDQVTQDLKPTSGSVEYPYHKTFQKFKDNLGIVYDSTPFYPMLKVQEILNLFSRIYKVDYKEKNNLIEFLQIGHIQGRLFNKLSKGERKKVGLFIAFCHQPEVVILDEPTGELDPLIRDVIWKKVFQDKDNERSLIFTTHQWEEAHRYADKIAFISKGQIVGDVLHKDEILEKVKGKKITVSKDSIDMNVDSRLSQVQFQEDDSNLYFFPVSSEERDFVQLISNHTLNFSIEEKSLEDYYKTLI